jgi:hypothetical protein
MKPAARHFVLLTLAVAGAICGGFGLLNYLVDPFNRYGCNRLGVYVAAERESKPTDVRRYPHNALLMGNSRMAMIPVQPVNGFRFFNAGFGGGTAAEAYHFLDHYATNLELVVLGIELGQYAGASSEPDIFAPPGWHWTLNNLLNVKTVESSVQTIAGHLSGDPPTLRVDGSFDAQRWFEVFDRPNPAVLEFHLERMKRGCIAFTGPAPGGMVIYARTAQLLRQRRITGVVLIPPFHEAVAKAIQNTPSAMAGYQAWRRELDAIFPDVVDLSLGPYCAAENFFQTDPVHFKPEAGVRMLNQEVIPVAIRAVRRDRAAGL